MDELEQFLDDLASRAATPRLGAEEADAILDLARVVAHTSERRLAPLTAYAAGLAAGDERDATVRVAALRRLITVVRDLARDREEPADSENLED